MKSDYQISLNFIPVLGNFPEFTVYRRLQTPGEPRPNERLMAYRLPASAEDASIWSPYWVSIEKMPRFEPFRATASMNPDLTRRVLFGALESVARSLLEPEQYWLPASPFIEELSFIQRSHDEGNELLVVQPYYLRCTRQLGYLVDFHFRLRDGVAFSRKVQQLSLSLDENYRRNLSYYIDRSATVNKFIQERQDVFGALRVPGSTAAINLGTDFVVLPADRLKTKVYVFAGNRESTGQFKGLRDYGPLKPLERNPRLLFVFREQDRHAARMLAMNLRGSTARSRYSFPGFKALFKCDLEIDGNPVVLSDLTQASIERALERAKQENQAQGPLVPILVLPEGDDSYLVQKSLFSHASIATQVCTLRILRDEDSLRWAVANLALQIFCKAGGQPWKVRPSGDRSIIIGISQSHKLHEIDGQRSVEKYFAFSVLTDSSGLFQRIQVLGEGRDEGSYLNDLKQNLQQVLNESAKEFSRVVVHTSFKLKHREIDAIQRTVTQAAQGNSAACRFAVVKVNQRCRFFGVNREMNSLVPYEATRVKLGPHEYLVWFEGIFPDRTTVTKAFPGPTHLQILRVRDENAVSDEILLQDLVNLSGANWRGFNAKSTPVSVFYCHLVAELVHDFHERSLPLPAVEDIRPWFL